MSQDVFQKGWTSGSFMGMEWFITIKRNLIPDDSVFFFADPKAIGKFYTLEDVVMWIKREAFLLDFFAYETIGGSIGNVSGLARADFA
jgi:hypothetical protein